MANHKHAAGARPRSLVEETSPAWLSLQSSSRHFVSFFSAVAACVVLVFCAYALPQQYSYDEVIGGEAALTFAGLALGLKCYSQCAFAWLGRWQFKRNTNRSGGGGVLGVGDTHVVVFLAVEGLAGLAALASIGLYHDDNSRAAVVRFARKVGGVVLANRALSQLELHLLSPLAPTARGTTSPLFLGLLVCELAVGVAVLRPAVGHTPTMTDLVVCFLARLPVDYAMERRLWDLDPDRVAHRAVSFDHELAYLVVATLQFVGMLVALYLYVVSFYAFALDAYELGFELLATLMPVVTARWIYQTHGGPRHTSDKFAPTL